MNKKYIIKKNLEIQEVYNNKDGKKVCDFFVVYFKKNNLNHNKYCISISKKIGKANVRNLYKRKIKDIIMKNDFNNSNDYVIIVRKQIIGKKYLDIKNEITNILERN